MRRIALSALVAVIAVAVVRGSGAEEDALSAQARRLFAPLPEAMVSPDNPITAEKVALGRQLFFEPRVSADGTELRAVSSTRALRHRRAREADRRP
jgi:cytochrome c peroxidase